MDGSCAACSDALPVLSFRRMQASNSPDPKGAMYMRNALRWQAEAAAAMHKEETKPKRRVLEEDDGRPSIMLRRDYRALPMPQTKKQMLEMGWRPAKEGHLSRDAWMMPPLGWYRWHVLRRNLLVIRVVEFWAKISGLRKEKKPKIALINSSLMMASRLAKAAEDARVDREAEAKRAAQAEADAAAALALESAMVVQVGPPKRKKKKVYKEPVYPPQKSWSVEMWLAYMSGTIWDYPAPSKSRVDEDRRQLQLSDGYKSNGELKQAWQDAASAVRDQNRELKRLEDRSVKRPPLHLSATKASMSRARTKPVQRLSYFNPNYEHWAASQVDIDLSA